LGEKETVEMGEFEDYPVSELMSSPPITIRPSVSIKEAAKIMVENNIGSLIVVDDKGSIIGIVTVRDIIREVVAKGLSPDKIKVEDIMTRNIYYILSDDTIKRAVEIMSERGIGHLPVIDPNDYRLVGVISKTDILKIAPGLFGALVLSKIRRRASSRSS
jgi:CBS domain-containing protein